MMRNTIFYLENRGLSYTRVNTVYDLSKYYNNNYYNTYLIIIIKNNRGPSTKPCGTPQVICSLFESELSVETNNSYC